MRPSGCAVVVALVLGCSQAPNESEMPEMTPAVFNPTGAPTVQFSVPDMMCAESCAAKTKEILSELPGAKDVMVDFDTKTATVAIEEGTFDADAAIAALVDYSFVNSRLKGKAVVETVAKPEAIGSAASKQDL